VCLQVGSEKSEQFYESSCKEDYGGNAVIKKPRYKRNQEDSVILNQSAIERGLFSITTFFTIDCTAKKRDTHSYEDITIPPINSDSSVKEGSPGYFKRKNANYKLLDSNGIVRPRERFENGEWVGEATRVKKGDVIIGKVIVMGSKSGEETKEDASIVIEPGEEGIVDRIHVLTTPAGHKLVKVVIRISRDPILGDKLASNSAQKGTIGMVYKQEDMPYTKDGITPDIIINPLCMPSRMTINQLIGCALGKSSLITGEYGDATPFASTSVNAADQLIQKSGDKLIEYGFQPQGWETMYNGMTGEMIEAKIFIGPTFYQRLKHMVSDKMHARATGGLVTLTRQPLEGSPPWKYTTTYLKNKIDFIKNFLKICQIIWLTIIIKSVSLIFLLRNIKIDTLYLVMVIY
jgi:DNA-directed RNA polymerase II subunit RPB2